MADQPLSEQLNCAPRCHVCGVEYAPDYEGPCQEPRGEHAGWSSVCPGRVSWRATAEALYEIVERRQREWDYKVELFGDRDQTQHPRTTRAPGC